MPFSDAIVRQAWTRSGERCECTKITHGHGRVCRKRLLEIYRGDNESVYGWEACSKSGAYRNDVDDCVILCWDCQEELHYL
jgi:hypothetical protein